MSNRDDDRFKELEEWDRDTYFHFFVGDKHYRMPKPFEVGVIFGTLPERMVESIIEEDRRAEDFFKRLAWNFGQTLSMNPTPQLIKPLVEKWANRSFFTDRPIVGMRLERLAKEAQYEPWTSATMRKLGETWGVSPKHAEQLVRGYFGTIGSYILAATDVVTRGLYDFPDRPSQKLEEMPVISAFYRGKGSPKNTRYMTEFYEMTKEVSELYNAVNAYRVQGEQVQASDVLLNNQDKLKYRGILNRRRASISKINKRIRRISYNKQMSGERKQVMIDQLIDRKNKIARSTMSMIQSNR
jgi:hypothetical protein